MAAVPLPDPGAPARGHALLRALARSALVALGTAAVAAAVEVPLAAPLTTIVTAPSPAPDVPVQVTAELEVPADAPADLAVGAWEADAAGTWYQTPAQALASGRHALRLDLDRAHQIGPGRGAPAWSPAAAAVRAHWGLYVCASRPSAQPLRLLRWAATPLPAPAVRERLLELGTPALVQGCIPAATGERLSLSVLPDPFPADPDDPQAFHLTLLLTAADGQTQRIAGFADAPMREVDRGDRACTEPAGPPRMCVRWRPSRPGRYRAALEAQWGSHPVLREELPPIEVSGKPWDGYVRVDARDPRFLSVDGRWFLPVGPNLRSVYDRRCAERLGTRLTPDRGLAAYHAYLARLAAAGVSAVEVWMSAWNLGLEWRASWPGYHGAGRYHDGHAWELDQLLDDAYAQGIRVILVLDNHGQASDRTDHEWENHPYNRACGGWLDQPAALFRDARAEQAQDRLRQYVVARYADHPGLLAWKLWSEINLTAAAGESGVLRDWHAQASERLHALDPYGHPCTTHWAMDYRQVFADWGLASLPGIDLICVDAYHLEDDGHGGHALADLLADTIGANDGRRRSLAHLDKPVLITEFGGEWNACPPAQLAAEHASAPFLALVDGLAGTPMLWWFEWIDQGARFAPYRAIQRFCAGEDVRDPRGGSIPLVVPDAWWARAWSRPGRMLGYACDRQWAATGAPAASPPGATIATPAPIAPGILALEWWDADTGTRLAATVLHHPGGVLVLQPPPFVRHIAFKLARVPTDDVGDRSVRGSDAAP